MSKINRAEELAKLKESVKNVFKFNNKVKEEVKKLKVEFSDFQTTDGLDICTDDGNIEVGSDVYQMDMDGNRTTIDDGTYTLTNGETITVADGEVTEMIGAEENKDGEQSPDEEADDVEGSDKKDELDPKKAGNVPDALDTKLAGGPDGDLAAEEGMDDDSDIWDAINELKDIITNIVSGADQEFKKIDAKMSKIANLPGDKSISNSRGNIYASNGGSDFMSSVKNKLTKPKQKLGKSLNTVNHNEVEFSRVDEVENESENFMDMVRKQKPKKQRNRV